MQKPINHKAINWVDGMKLSSAQFVQTDLYHQELTRDSIAVNIHAYNYGVLPPFAGHEKGAEITLLLKSTNQIEASVFYCNAITADGGRIDITANSNGMTAQHSEYISTQDLKEGDYYIVLKLDHENRIPVGQPDPSESPIRYPELSKKYAFEIVSEMELRHHDSVSYFLPVGQFRWYGGAIELNKNYVIPCTSLNSSIELKRVHLDWYNRLNDFQISAFKIMDKTSQTDRITDIGLNVRAISEKALYYLAEKMYTYRTLVAIQPPIELVRYFSDLTHLFFTSIKLIPAVQREELLKYFYEWKDVTPSNFEERISEMIEIQYDHLNIHQSIEHINNFLDVLVPLWNKLSTLEYIGQRKENIVVAEQKVVQEVQKKRTWSLLD